MMRLLVSVSHLSLALLLGASGLVLLAQARLNGLWEAGFYRSMSPATLVLTTGSMLVLILSGIGVLGAVAWARGHRWAGLMLLLLSLFYGFTGAPPLSWLFIALAGALVADLWLPMARAALQDED